MTVTKNLKSLRAQINFNQQDMANYLGIGITTYHNKETGKNQFTLKEAKQIAQLFNLTIDDIFFTNLVNFKNTKVNSNILCAFQEVENN